jgi:conjugative relaxase-like TrwC/TraI family protein
MIRPSEISSAKDAASYYSDVARAAEYYQGEGIPNQWMGKGAEQFGLSGAVSQEALEAALEGRVNGQQLGRQAKDGSIEHRKGWDFTISAPKSVSLAALAFGRDDVREAHRQAARAAMRYLEERVESRINGQVVRTGSLTMAQYEHVTSRKGDPQLHWHVLVANATMHNGRAYSINNKSLFESYATADRIYHQTLSCELQRAGYQVNHTKRGEVEIAGYSRENLREFSKRAVEMEEALAERGKDRQNSSAAERETIALSTRAKTKNYIETREANIERWQAQAEAAGIRPPQQGAAQRIEAEGINEVVAAGHAVKMAVAHLSERNMVFNEKSFHQAIAAFNRGQSSWAGIEHAIGDMEDRGELIRNGEQFTARASVDAEIALEARVAAGQGQHQAVMTGAEFDQALTSFEERKGFALGIEQRVAARMILTGDDRFQGVQGLAGTGKTTMLEFVREAAEAKGWEVQGFSNGAEQAAKLEAESGIRSTTTARHLQTAKQASRSSGNNAKRAAYDAQLAQEALETWEMEQDRFIPRNLEWRALSQQGEVIRDSEGNRYARMDDGRLYAEKLIDPTPGREHGDYHRGGDGRTYQFHYVKANFLDPDGVRELGRDGYLAHAAIMTWEREQGRLFRSRIDFEKMARKGGVFFDSDGQRYVRDKQGWIFSEAMFKNERRAGQYVQGKGGAVFIEQRQKRWFREDKITYKKAGLLQSAYAKHLMRREDRSRQADERERLRDLLSHSRDRVREHGPHDVPIERLYATKNAAVSGLREVWGKHQIANGREAMRQDELARLNRLTSSEQAQGNKVLWVHDEASMSGVKEYGGMTQAAEKAGARVVSLGDQWQHQSVEAGKAFERLQQHKRTAELGRDSIRRQEKGSAAHRAVQATLDGKHKEALDAIEKVEIRTAQNKLAQNKPDAKRDVKREAAQQDNREVVKRIAGDYAALSPQARENTIVITATNGDRKAINAQIREAMRERGELGTQDRQVATLKKLDVTAQQQGRALQYRQDDPMREPVIVQAMETGKDEQMKAGQQFEVIGVNEHANTIKLRNLADPQQIVTVDPARVTLQAYERDTRRLTEGDSIRFTENHHLTAINGEDVKVINGQFAQVTSIDADRATLLIHDVKGQREPERVTVSTTQPLKIDHAATYTSFKAQGQGKGQAWIHHNTEVGGHGVREAYVNITRAKVDARIYTQNLDKALDQMGVQHDKASAIEFAKAAEQAKAQEQAIRDTLKAVQPQENPFDIGFEAPSAEQFAEWAKQGTRAKDGPQVEPSRDDLEFDFGR